FDSRCRELSVQPKQTFLESVYIKGIAVVPCDLSTGQNLVIVFLEHFKDCLLKVVLGEVIHGQTTPFYSSYTIGTSISPLISLGRRVSRREERVWFSRRLFRTTSSKLEATSS